LHGEVGKKKAKTQHRPQTGKRVSTLLKARDGYTQKKKKRHHENAVTFRGKKGTTEKKSLVGQEKPWET